MSDIIESPADRPQHLRSPQAERVINPTFNEMDQKFGPATEITEHLSVDAIANWIIRKRV